MSAIPAAAFDELRRVYAELSAELEPLRRHCDMRGICCNFREHGHKLFVTGLEAAEMARSGEQPDSEQSRAGVCPFLRGKLCGVREHRALGCRIYYCDTTYEEQRNAVYEKFLKLVREIEAKHKIEHTYSDVTKLEFPENAG